MSLTIPKRTWFTLREVGTHWKVDEFEVRYWLISGYLTAHVWLPVMSVIERSKSDQQSNRVKMHHWQGYAELSKDHCHRLFRMGTIRLREFHDSCKKINYVLPDSAEDIPIVPDDLMILEQDRIVFEQALFGTRVSHTNNFSKQPEPPIPHSQSPSFRSVRLGKVEHHFGSMQARTLELLYQAAKAGRPWCNGKRLLAEIGSESFSLSNLFKRKPIWRDMIQSNERGYYRMHPDFFMSCQDPTKS